jgi:hypothetical protein
MALAHKSNQPFGERLTRSSWLAGRQPVRARRPMPLGFAPGLCSCRAGNSFAWARFSGVLGAVLTQEGRSRVIEQLFDLSAIGQSTLDGRHHGQGDVEAPPFSFAGKGQEVVGVFISRGASGAVWTNAGFVDQRQRPFEGGPKSSELLEKLLGSRWPWMFLLHKAEYSIAVCIYMNMRNYNPKKPSVAQPR